MEYKILALLIMAVFYGIYFAKMMIQKKKGIVTDQIAKGKVHDKGFYIEVIMKIATCLIPLVEVISIVIGRSSLAFIWRVIGVYFGVVGDIVFFLAVWTMRDSWRAGVAKDDEKRNLVTEGIYRYSRNPAFLGFDLVYIGILLMYANPVLYIITFIAVTMLHLQILQEESYLKATYGNEYLEYRDKTSRYAGYGKVTFSKVIMYGYFLLFIWSVCYFVTCLAYGGGLRLSWVWLWALIAAFSALRVWMIKGHIDGNERFKIPGVLRWIYRVAFVICLSIFLFTEFKIVKAMTAHPSKDLDYVVVLGAGMIGDQPTNPLRVRIERAARYMEENENTVLIASGGKGIDEQISEAECIKNYLLAHYDIDESRIILEDKSRDTEENLANSLVIIGDPEASVGIVTNSFHEYRALTIARHTGYKNAESVPATTLMPVGIHYVVREFFGMVELLLKYEM
ncbi:ElyC/SanA/YdcF family protein [Butyrivibrio proteoclasticus]|uniref:ElyC/SanA/YdcF family protein n=1 Tax=Butyrivibrio proteoclasticus TaxID=43305 RepID=UPI000B1CD7D9|nr:ElyC/SanA/YdcF family protein [Butyrivibrio proteoclasticus]